MNRSNFPESHHLYSSVNDPSQSNFGSNSNPASSYIIQPPSNYVFDAHYSSSTFIPPSQGRSRGGQSSMLPTMSQGLSSSSTTLFVGDISILCNEETIYDLFCTYGAIESVQLKKSERDPQRAHLSYGFVKFVTPESATLALQELNGKFVQGRCLRVGWADDHPGAGGHGRGGKAIDQKKNNQTAQIHVMFVCKDLEMMVSEVNLGSIFGSFGNLVDIAIKKNVANHELRVRSGYGFVHYALTKEGIQSAVTAVEEMNHRTVDNISFECKVTHSLQAHMFSMRRSDYGPGINHPPIPPPTSSYMSYPSNHRSAPAAAYLPGQSGFREASPSYAPRVPPSVPFAPQRGFTHQQGFPVHLQHSPSYVNPVMSTYNADNTRYRRAPEREDYLTSADLQRQYEGLEPSYRSSYPAPPATATLNMREDSYMPTYTTSSLNPTVYPQQSPTPPIAANEASSFSSFTKELNESLSLLDSEKEGDARKDEQETAASAVVTEEGKDPNY